MQIKIKTLTGRTLALDFEPSAVVRCPVARKLASHPRSPPHLLSSPSRPQFRTVKEALQEKEGIDVSQMCVRGGGHAHALQGALSRPLQTSPVPHPPFPTHPPPLSRLLFGGAQCGDAETLEAKNVKAGDSLHMVLALRGGC